MGSYGGSKASSVSGARNPSVTAPPKQQPTKAKLIENMNEAQIDTELAKANKRISQLEKTMKQNLGSSAWEQGMREAFPLGAGGLDEKTRKRIVGRENSASLNKATKYVEAMKERDQLSGRVSALEKAKNQISGTGKTQKQIKEKSTKKLVNELSSNSERTWSKTTETSLYGKTIVRTSGNYQIHTTGGTSFIYVNGKQIGMTNGLKKAQAFVESYDKRKKK